MYGGDGTSKECMSSNCKTHKKNKKYIGYDCSGYIYSLLSKWGYNKFGRSTSQMQASNGYGKWITNKKDLLPGDLIFFDGHVGIVSKIENGKIYMYHSPKCGDVIKESESSYRKDFKKGLRIIKESISTSNSKGGDNMKICINYGHAASGAGTGAVGLLNESNENRNVGKEVVRLLKENSSHTVIVADYNGSNNYVDSVNYANNQKADLFVSIHFNSGANDKNGDGKSCGTETLVYNTSYKHDEAKRIHANIVKLGYRDRKIKSRSDLYVLKNTKMNALLVECCFVDDRDDVNLYNYKTMAKAIAEGILNKSIAAPAPPPTSNNGFVVGDYNKDVIVTADSLNVRDGRGSEFKIIGSFPKNTRVNMWYIGKAKDGSLWGSCSCNGKTGYIHTGYVRPV